MTSIYGRLQPKADRLMAKFTQGAGILVVAGEKTGPDWNPVAGEPTEHPFNYTKAKSSLMFKYREDSRIEESDLLIIASRMVVVPKLKDQVKLDGVVYQIVMVDPATLVQGKPMVYRLALRA